jgi:putative RNA 2'-phosphotransferase
MENQEKRLKGYSKFLSYVLRHNPGQIGLELDKNGWADVKKLLRHCEEVKRARGLNREIMDEVVATNNKKRFEYSKDGTKIRARQGHSVEVDLGNKPTEPPETLYHGTPTKFVEPIKSGGLLKMNRHAVHLSKDYATALDVGKRRGKPVIIKVKAKKMHDDGHQFYLTANGVWYTEHVPTDFLVWPDDPRYGARL